MSYHVTKRQFTMSICAIGAALLISACGGSDPVITKLSVTPALGAVYGGVVEVFSSTGTLLGTGVTTRPDGKVVVNMTNYTSGSPVVIKVSLPVGAIYFDEKADGELTIDNTNTVSLLSVLPAVGTNQSVGVTPITNMAAKLTGLDVETVGVTNFAFTVTARAIYESVAKTNLILGLPATTNILVAPVPASEAEPNPTDTMGLILAIMVRASTTDAISQSNALADAVKTDGTVDVTKTEVITQVNDSLVDPTATQSLNLVIKPANTAPTPDQITAAVKEVETVLKPPTPATGAGS
jgi:hypothetical protein